MKTVTPGDVVSVHYTGKLENGEVFDSSEGKEPLSFQVGSGMVIKGFNDAVIGMREGEEKEVTLSPEEAYGYRNEELVKDVPKEMLGGQFEPEVGMMLAIQMEDGSKVPATITDVQKDSIVIDLNPPLAGETLNFKITLMKISDAPQNLGCSCSTCDPSKGCGSL